MLQQQSPSASSDSNNSSSSSGGEGFTQKMMGKTLDEFPRHKLPGNFETYKMPSSFFVNFWPTLFNLSIILLVTVFILLLEYYTRDLKKVHPLIQSLAETLKWNVALILFCGSLGDVVLFTALEIQSMQFDNSEAIISFIICILINILAIFVVVKILDVNLAIRKYKQQTSLDNDPNEQKKQIDKQYSSYRALFECYRDYSYYQQIFLFVFIIRMAFFNGIIGLLYKYPLVQACLFTLSNILMLFYLFVKRPIKKIVNLVQQIVLELALLPFNICILILTILDKLKIEALDQRKNIGNVIFYINIAIPFISLVLMAAKLIAICIEFYQERKAQKSKEIRNLKGFNIHVVRETAILNNNNTTRDIVPTTTLPSTSMCYKGPLDNTQVLDSTHVLDISDNIDFTRSRGDSVHSMSSFSHNFSRKRKPRFQHPELILPDIAQEKPKASPPKDVGFQGVTYNAMSNMASNSEYNTDVGEQVNRKPKIRPKKRKQQWTDAVIY